MLSKLEKHRYNDLIRKFANEDGIELLGLLEKKIAGDGVKLGADFKGEYLLGVKDGIAEVRNTFIRYHEKDLKAKNMI